MLKNWTKELEESIRHICDPNGVRGKDDGKSSIANFKKIEEAMQHGLTVKEKEVIDQLTLGQLQSKYSFLNQVNPYQGVDATNIKEHQYIIGRWQKLLAASAPKPYSLQDDPSYVYYQQMVETGIDPSTGMPATELQLSYAKAYMGAKVLQPFAQAFVLASTAPSYSEIADGTYWNKTIKTVDSNPADDVSELPQYSAKGGGGAVTNTVIANGKTVTFKHGARHITKDARALKLNYLEAEEAIAEHVTKLDLNPGKNDFIKISFQGEIIEFRPYVLDDGTINVGTYIVEGY